MNLLTKIRGLEKTRLIQPGDISLPTINLDGYTLVNIALVLDDINSLMANCKNPESFSDENIQPFGAPFGISASILATMIKKPSIIIDNHKNIAKHEIHLIRRNVGKVIIASQFHFINNRLFLVIDEFNPRHEMLGMALKKSLNGYLKLIPAVNNEESSKLIKDQKGNFLFVESKMNFLARYCSPEIWEGS